MTTSYAVKKCNSIGFASDFEHLSMKYSEIELSNDNVMFISDDSVNWNHNSMTVEEFANVSPPSDHSRPLIVVELARRSMKTIKIPVECDDSLAVEDFAYDIIDEDTLIQYKDSFLGFIKDNECYEDKKLSKDFIDFIAALFPELLDGHLKRITLDVLRDNGYNTMKLETDYPIDYNEEEVETVSPLKLFEDIRITINKNDTNAKSSSAVYKSDKAELNKASVGSSTQLEAFSKNRFTVIHSKKSANIDNKIYKRNHDVLDSLARNGVVCSPDTGAVLSIHRLMLALKKYKSFDICFVHPSYELKCCRSEVPSELIEPSYIINDGELLAIVYRYIVVSFFGYSSVFTEGMEELVYLI